MNSFGLSFGGNTSHHIQHNKIVVVKKPVTKLPFDTTSADDPERALSSTEVRSLVMGDNVGSEIGRLVVEAVGLAVGSVVGIYVGPVDG